MPAPLPIIQYRERPGILDLGWGHPHPSALPTRSWLAATEEMLTTYGWRAMTYGHGAGPGPLLEWLNGHVFRCEVPSTFVTAGASHALELVSTVLTRPGDVVVVDSPTYHLALRILRDRGVSLVGALADRDGLDPAATAEVIAAARRAGRRVPLLYVVPTFGNPTGQSLPMQRRRALVDLALRTGVTIVEDDTYRELAYEGVAPQSLWSLAGGAGVVRIGSFSKTVAPGLRLGWINAAAPLIRTLTGLGYVDSGGGVNHITALIMATFGASGAYAEHLAEVRLRYASQRDALVGAMRSLMPGIPVASPAGGWFLWLRLPAGVDPDALLPAAEQRGVSYLDGRRFHTGDTGQRYIRLSFSMLSPPDLRDAAHRLAAALP